MNNSLVNKFTQHFRGVIERAYYFSSLENSAKVSPIHLLWGLLTEGGSLANEILRKAGVKLPDSIEAHQPHETPPLHLFKYPFSESSKKIIRSSTMTASQYNHKYIGTEHLLQGLLHFNDPAVHTTLQSQQVDIAQLKSQISLVLKSTSRFPDLAQAITQTPEEPGEKSQEKKSKTPALDYFATELTGARVQKRIDPLVGREQEISRIIQILSRKNKNNPILLGDPGVGKTAIVEGLAQRIFEGNVPDMLLRKRIYSLDLSLIVAGTVYRGEFESRIKQIIDEAKSDDSIILFIDEIHTIVGAGSASGSLDAANILKPALARGEVRCIGATTFEEYKRHLETDPALERRFQAVMVAEPSIEETVAILKGIKSSYESHHRVSVETEALEAAAKLSSHYLTDKRLPDKAIDLIDEASARKRIMSGADPHLRLIRDLETKLQTIRREKELAVQKEDFPLALKHKEEERETIEKIQEAKTTEASGAASRARVGMVVKEDILSVLSSITGIPLGALMEEERDKLLNLETLLAARIVGQEETLHEIAGFIRRSRAGIAGANRPLGSFMFLGPSGVGKTETAKALADIVYRDPDALIRFDMSEFSESFQTAKLIGAPAGYVGYREGGKLTELVRRKPYSVILLDEMEKAHPDVFNLFLSILDEGHLTDATGKRADFRNSIIIMTSNVGLSAFNQHALLGFETSTDAKETMAQDYSRITERAMSDLKERFRPEFLNRIDRVIVFHPLNAAHLRDIVRMHLEQLQRQLKTQNIGIDWDQKTIEHLTQQSISPTEGARRVRKIVREHAEDQLAEAILNKSITPGMTAHFVYKGGKIVLANKKSKAKAAAKKKE